MNTREMSIASHVNGAWLAGLSLDEIERWLNEAADLTKAELKRVRIIYAANEQDRCSLVKNLVQQGAEYDRRKP